MLRIVFGFAIERHVIKRKFARAADGENHQKEEHQTGEFERLSRRQQTFSAVNKEDRTNQNRNLDERRKACQEADRQQQASHEMSQDHVVKQDTVSEPRLPSALHQIVKESRGTVAN